MSSSQPVVTPNALNFTPDNKHGYAYSGEIAVGSSVKTLLEFQTNSEYLISEIQIMNGTTSNEDFKYVVYFNDVAVARWHFLYASTIHQLLPNPLYLVIPPFTTVKIKANNLDSSTERIHTAVVTGKVIGLADVGYQ